MHTKLWSEETTWETNVNIKMDLNEVRSEDMDKDSIQ